MSEARVRTRFAPSPTGLMHIGGLRTALFSWALAKRHGGDFILRLEDTDQTRKVPEAVRSLLEMFRWVGLDVDEGPSASELETLEPGLGKDFSFGGEYGPYIQSLRLERYREVAEQLIASGHAYRCDISEDELSSERQSLKTGESSKIIGRNRNSNLPKEVPHSIRFRMPDAPKVLLHDGVRGEIEWTSIPLQDPILLKSDGFATYHLAATVDDHDMLISHVFRGEEWLASAPLHILIYEALGWSPPVFCHLPVILGADGKKLSKRHGSTTWSLFREEGYLPEALVNFIALIGWSPKGDQEIFDREFLAQHFSIEGVQSASGILDFEKLAWMNSQYIRKLSEPEFLVLAKEHIPPSFASQLSCLEPIAGLLKERVRIFSDLSKELWFFEDSRFQFDPELIPEKIRSAALPHQLRALAELFSALPEFAAEPIENCLKDFLVTSDLKAGQLFLPVRIAVTGTKESPALSPTLEALGRGRCTRRLMAAADALEVSQPTSPART